MSELNLSPECVTRTIATLKADAGVQKQWRATADLLISEGVNAASLTEDKEYRKVFMSEVVLLSFTKAEQAIMSKPHTSLSDEEKVTKRWVQTESASRLGKVVRYIKKAEEESAMTDEERGAKKRSDMATQLKRDLAKWIDKIQKAEAVTFPALKVIEALKNAEALIK